MRYLFDTSFFIDALRLKKEAREVFSQFEGTDDELLVPSIVGFELFSGESSAKPMQVKKIKEFLDFFEIVDLTWEIAQRAGKIFRSGIREFEVPDYIIAATALEIKAVVVTLNRKHFGKIPGLVIYP